MMNTTGVVRRMATQSLPPMTSSSTAVTSIHKGASDADIPKVLAKAIKSNLVGTQSGFGAALFYDVDAYRSTLTNLKDTFGEHFVHCKAVKSNPLKWAMRETVGAGLGLECASMNEVASF